MQENSLIKKVGFAAILLIALIGGIIFLLNQKPKNENEEENAVTVAELLKTYQGKVVQPEIGKEVIIRLTISAVDTAAHLLNFNYTVHGKGDNHKNQTGEVDIKSQSIVFSTLGKYKFYKTNQGKVILRAVENKNWKLTEN